MKAKKYCVLVVFIWFALLIIIGGTVVIVDPYFHYHEPLAGEAYAFNDTVYMNDGITKHFEYTGIITGSSTSLGFSTAQAEEIFGGDFIRISYPGEGFKKIHDNLSVAISYNDQLNTVIWGLDTLWFVSEANMMGYDEYPEYLYDNNIWNDVNYLYNKEILIEDTMPTIWRTLTGCVADTFDSTRGYPDEVGSRESVLQGYNRMERTEKEIDPVETETFFRNLNQNLEQNVISLIEENPQIEFYIFFPPYSICWWDSLNQYGTAVLMRRIDMEQFAIEKLIEYENVHLFSFFNDFEMICDLDHYVDYVHYTQFVSEQVLEYMGEGMYEITKDNYREYIDAITEFYCVYDYDSIFD